MSVEPEVQSASVGEQLVAQGATLMRIENDSMMSVAIQRPRDEEKVIKRALRELEIAPENASAAYYSIPYKERQPGGGHRIVKVEGPSIKAAMSLARRWGNCTVASRIMGEDESGYDLEGIFLDYETNFRVCRPFRVSKSIRTKKGIMRLDGQRELQAVQSGASKAIRNATIAGLPDYLVSAYIQKARSIVGGKHDQKAPAETIAATLRAFAKLDATKEQLEAYTKLTTDLWTGSEIADLRGLWNAIQDGQITAQEAFAVAEEADPIAKPVRASEINGAEGQGAEQSEGAATNPGDGALRVSDVEVKTGETKGKPWTLYRIIFSDDREAVTFSHTIGQKAQAAKEAKAPVEIELIPDKKGDGLEVAKLEIIEPKAESTEQQGSLLGSEG